MNTEDPNYGRRSDDGTQWWDGTQWEPVPPAQPEKTKSRLPLIIGSVLGLLVLTGAVASLQQSTAEEARPEPTTRSTPTYTPAPEYTPEPTPEYTPTLSDAAWLALLSEWPAAENVGRAKMEEYAEIACEAFDTGTSFEDAALLAVETGFDPGEAGTIIGYAIFGFCPENQGILP